MIHQEAEIIREKLETIEGVGSVTRGWPKRLERLPCIAVSKASDTPVGFADDREHIAQLEYYIRIFAQRAREADTLTVLVDAVMEDLGYMRTFSYDDDNGEVRIAALRYRRFV
ncbi:MAG: hypothetical protein IKB82_04965 [Clostridia bacterium]|nr:hypothetical protein [Clostridia bacterium]